MTFFESGLLRRKSKNSCEVFLARKRVIIRILLKLRSNSCLFFMKNYRTFAKFFEETINGLRINGLLGIEERVDFGNLLIMMVIGCVAARVALRQNMEGYPGTNKT